MSRRYDAFGGSGDSGPLALFFPNHIQPWEVTDEMIERCLAPDSYRERISDADGWAAPSAVQARIDFYGGLCWMCGDDYDEIDHVKPIIFGGSNWPANLRPACRGCNAAKGGRWPI